jgi:hypothetical protein
VNPATGEIPSATESQKPGEPPAPRILNPKEKDRLRTPPHPPRSITPKKVADATAEYVPPPRCVNPKDRRGPNRSGVEVGYRGRLLDVGPTPFDPTLAKLPRHRKLSTGSTWNDVEGMRDRLGGVGSKRTSR